MDTQPLDNAHPQLAGSIDRALASAGVPGAAVGIVDGDKTFIHVVGHCAADNSETVTADTAFDIGSCSKSVVATAVAVLVSAGKLQWDEPVHPYLPELKLDDTALTKQLTVRDLLCNRIGLKRQVPLESFANPDIGPEMVLARIGHLDRVYPFRAGYVYFNPGFIAARLLVERVNGMNYNDFLQRELFAPLGMHHAASGSDAVAVLPMRAVGHARIGDVSQPLREEHAYDNWQGAAGVYMSTTDMLVWLRFHLADGAPLIDAATFAQLSTPHGEIPAAECKLIHRPPGADRCDYCLGWWRTMFGGEQLVQHAGEMFGWRAQVALLPDRRTGVAVLLNQDSAQHAQLVYTILDHLLGTSGRDWQAIADTAAQELRSVAQQAMEQLFAVSTTTMPLKLSAYCGRYQHPATGALTVAPDGEGLAVAFDDGSFWQMQLSPIGGHVFECRFTRAAAQAYMPVPLRVEFEVQDDRVIALRELSTRFLRDELTDSYEARRL